MEKAAEYLTKDLSSRSAWTFSADFCFQFLIVVYQYTAVYHIKL